MTCFVSIFLLTTGAICVVINKVAILSVYRRNTIVHFYWIFGKLLKTVHYHRTLIPCDKKNDDNNRSGKFIKPSINELAAQRHIHLNWKLLFQDINIYSTNTITTSLRYQIRNSLMTPKKNKKFTFFQVCLYS